MERVIKIIFAVLLIFVTVYGIGVAMQDVHQQSSQVTLVIMPTGKLDIINNDVTKTITQGDPVSETALSSGYVEFDPDKPTLIVDSNEKWKLSVKSTDFTGPYSKNIADLQLKDLSGTHVKNGFDDYKPLSKSDQDIAMYDNGVKAESHPLQYKVLLDWQKDVPGTYEATVTYTLSTGGA